jgi:hypothetical protein
LPAVTAAITAFLSITGVLLQRYTDFQGDITVSALCMGCSCNPPPAGATAAATAATAAKLQKCLPSYLQHASSHVDGLLTHQGKLFISHGGWQRHWLCRALWQPAQRGNHPAWTLLGAGRCKRTFNENTATKCARKLFFPLQV